MVSGSSDRRACVWDIWIGEGGQVRAEVRAVLKGHLDGVLDLRVDDQWVVSCSKDTKIRVWNRETLELHRTLSGHEGPVNAIGLQNGLIVSASGDTKMMLWDIERGTCLRTFDGHDRGLACIEFKDNYIVSGSSDCKIKDASSARAMTRQSRYGTFGRGVWCSSSDGTISAISLTSSLMIIESLGLSHLMSLPCP
ncbi:WD40-repeat-containing domain protein [Multifurca ochricompacta]|uniref:WD40-repeat-containing domain protein n=1 Tax=Multifurca ochricompacta TaxID=376703 RepID=A0AAD4QK85_9AGAM|nr:WD40-repeat-containing domain protein [Multifurca ochricompacta]